MLICKGQGNLMIDPVDGEVIWAPESSPVESFCKEKGFRSANYLLGLMNLDQQNLALPECPDCDNYSECIRDLEDNCLTVDNTMCSAFNEEAISKSIMSALMKFTENERKEVLN